jgi:hypothetical protein
MDAARLRVILFAGYSALAAACSSSAGEPPVPSGEVDSGTPPPALDSGASNDAGAADAAPCVGLIVDDAGVTHGCGAGGTGMGDHDDGGGMVAPPPTVPMNASNLPYGSSCWNNAQCISGICFDYRVKGTFCTQTCMNAADCPLLPDSGGTMSAGCNGMGVCRIP